MGPAGFVAVIAGWVTTEVGRQPYTVYGLLRTVEGPSRNVSAANTLFTLLGFMGLYALLAIFVLFLLRRQIELGPEAGPHVPATVSGGGER
jgi:cytochrome d ubiquinol oxidase subunit I